jgi:DNA-binding response OmpR family regulator
MKKRLLLADDSITIQKVVELIFSSEEIEVQSVFDGEAAWEKVRQERPDIVLADVVMPKLDGFELCRRIKQDPDLSAIPVVLLVSIHEHYEEARGAEVQANAYITKPFESSELIGTVRNAIEQAAAFRAAPTIAPSVEAAPIAYREKEMEAAIVGEEFDVEPEEALVGEEEEPVAMAEPIGEAETPEILDEAELWKGVELTEAEATSARPGASIEPPPSIQAFETLEEATASAAEFTAPETLQPGEETTEAIFAELAQEEGLAGVAEKPVTVQPLPLSGEIPEAPSLPRLREQVEEMVQDAVDRALSGDRFRLAADKALQELAPQHIPRIDEAALQSQAEEAVSRAADRSRVYLEDRLRQLAHEAVSVAVEQNLSEDRMQNMAEDALRAASERLMPTIQETISRLADAALQAAAEQVIASLEGRIREQVEQAIRSAAAQNLPSLIEQSLRERAPQMMRELAEEALTRASQEVSERIVWEVVPDLAETLITREIERLKAGA